MLEYFLTIQFKCLNLIGFYRPGFIKHPKIFRAIHCSNIFCCIFSLFGEGNFVIKNYQDVVTASEASAPFLIVIITMLKLIFFYRLKDDLFQSFDELKALITYAKLRNPKIMNLVSKVDKLSASVYTVACIAAGLTYVLAPALGNLINFVLVTGDYNYEMPMKSSFPYNDSLSPAYEFTYAMFGYGTYLAVLSNVST